MLNHASIETVARGAFGPGFIRPAYGAYCFAHLPDTIKHLFGLPAPTPLPADTLPDAPAFERVVVVLLDAFGWRLFEKHAGRSPFLREVVTGGVVSQLTAQFPSTTAAHMTCLHTGLPVGVSGVHEWFYYEPEIDVVIAPLLFSPAGDTQRDVLVSQGVRAERLFPRETIYADLQRAGVASYVFAHLAYARAAYSAHVTRGAQAVPFVTSAEAFVNLNTLLERERGRLYALVYVDAIDALSHHYGPGSAQVEAETAALLAQLDQFLRAASGRHRRTLLIVTADHGQIDIDPATTVYLNRMMPELLAHLKRNRQGWPLLFGGAARDLFLYIQDESLDAIQTRLAHDLAGRAVVQATQALIDQGLFGPPPVSQRLIDRIGNLAILPLANESVYWYEAGRFEQRFYGHHGGLAPDEMRIPFLAYAIL